jgi:quercetin dioxygenase-like cupin family protein
MSSVRIMFADEVAWRKSFVDREAQAGPTKEGLEYKSLMGMEPGTGLPNMQQVRFDPGYLEPIHSHPDDEILTVVTGSIAFGRDVLRPGDAIYVPKDTRYSLRAGDEGAEFIRVGMPL